MFLKQKGEGLMIFEMPLSMSNIRLTKKIRVYECDSNLVTKIGTGFDEIGEICVASLVWGLMREMGEEKERVMEVCWAGCCFRRLVKSQKGEYPLRGGDYFVSYYVSST